MCLLYSGKRRSLCSQQGKKENYSPSEQRKVGYTSLVRDTCNPGLPVTKTQNPTGRPLCLIQSVLTVVRLSVEIRVSTLKCIIFNKK